MAISTNRHERTRAILAAAFVLWTAGCGSRNAAPSSPSNPSTPLPYREGFAYLIVTGYEGVFRDGVLKGCPGILSPLTPPGILTSITLQRDGAGWIGKPGASGGTFELHLRDSPDSAPAGYLAVGGSVSGTLLAPPSLPSIRFGDQQSSDVAITGLVRISSSSFVTDGWVLGPAAFLMPDGRTISCAPNTVSWHIEAGP